MSNSADTNTQPASASMTRIRKWRNRRKEAEKMLTDCYEQDLPEGTVVWYIAGKHRIEVKIIETSWWYPMVENIKTGRQYRISWERFEGIIEA